MPYSLEERELILCPTRSVSCKAGDCNTCSWSNRPKGDCRDCKHWATNPMGPWCNKSGELVAIVSEDFWNNVRTCEAFLD